MHNGVLARSRSGAREAGSNKEMTMKLAIAAFALHFTLASAAAWAQVNAGDPKPACPSA
jgi:hypothetical protein